MEWGREEGTGREKEKRRLEKREGSGYVRAWREEEKGAGKAQRHVPVLQVLLLTSHPIHSCLFLFHVSGMFQRKESIMFQVRYM